MAEVHAAIKQGLLPSPLTLKCADCGGDATEYEHRDYNKPLAVDPICRSCNLRRGPAIPLKGSVERLLKRGLIPYRTRSRAQMLCRALGREDLAASVPRRVNLAYWRAVWPELNHGITTSTADVLPPRRGRQKKVAAASVKAAA